MFTPYTTHYVISTVHKNGKSVTVKIDPNKTTFAQVKAIYPDITHGVYYGAFINRYYSPTEGWIYCREILPEESKNYPSI